MWIRYNPALKYYEYSNNNGGSWAQLPMSASSITEGTFNPDIIGGNIAYTDIANVFTKKQQLQHPNPIISLVDMEPAVDNNRVFDIANTAQTLRFRALNDAQNILVKEPLVLNRAGDAIIGRDLVVPGQIRVSNPYAGAAGGAIRITETTYPAIYFISSGGAVDTKVWRQFGVNGTKLVFDCLNDAESGVYGAPISMDRSGDVTVGRDLIANRNVANNGGYMYPGQSGSGALQWSWYLASLSPYGLYSNTGLYTEGQMWMHSVEARYHVRANTALYDYGRGTPIGHWLDYTPTMYNGVINQILNCSYMIVGKTMWLNFYIQITTNGNVPGATWYLPAGMTSRGYVGVPFVIGAGAIIGMGHTVPGGNLFYLYRDQAGTGWGAGTYYVSGCVPIPIN